MPRDHRGREVGTNHVSRPSHELWGRDSQGYDWHLDDGDSDLLNERINSGVYDQHNEFGEYRVQPFGHNADRYYSVSSPDYEGDPRYERATHPAFKSKNSNNAEGGY